MFRHAEEAGATTSIQGRRRVTKKRSLKPSEYGGIILGFEPARTDTIQAYLAIGGVISESFSSQDWNLQHREMVYFARQGDQPILFGAGVLQKRGAGGGTKRVNMRLLESVTFDRPVHAYEAEGAETLGLAISTANSIRRFDANGWKQLSNLIKELRPEHAKRLEELARFREGSTSTDIESTRASRLSEERDAIGLALDIAGLDRKAILRTAAPERIDTATSVLDLIAAQPIAERSLIENDSRALKIALDSPHASAQFCGDRGREVRTYVLDGTPLETAMGVDLLLYQEQYNSFLLLQYKAMENDKNADGWSYPVRGTNLTSQLQLMESVRKGIPFNLPRKLRDQRLSEEPFYFKFCERRALLPSDEGLAAGITMSAPHLAHFLSLPEAIGVNNSVRVGYGNCPRYFNNTEFVSLARGGWIGCQGATTDAIARIIAAREEGRIAILAVIKGLALSAENRR